MFEHRTFYGGRGEKKFKKKGRGRIDIKVVDGRDVPTNLECSEMKVKPLGGRGAKKDNKKGRGRIQIKVVDGCDVTAELGVQGDEGRSARPVTLIHGVNTKLEHIPRGRGAKKDNKKGRGRIQIKVVDGRDVLATLVGAAKKKGDKKGRERKQIKVVDRENDDMTALCPQSGAALWRRPPATSGICLGMARMVVTTRLHSLAALNSLRRHLLASMYAVPARSPRRLRLTAIDADCRPTRRNSTPSSRAARRLYKLEGWGKVYVTTCVSDADVDEYRNGTLAGDDLVAKLQFKVGHTSSLTRRCHQYRKCEKGQTHIWLWSYDAAERYLAEHLIHLRLFGRKAHAVPQICPGCGVKHREFFCLAFVGGLRGLDKLVKEVLGLLGQKSVKRATPTEFLWETTRWFNGLKRLNIGLKRFNPPTYQTVKLA
ncbi:hypothetical protein B0H14DRAFT_2592073 [Mycena olivaceomarginata]|nr:hypothetical protein B0H14DRAFT_2592073 [Mycena olivaceomarginata]